MSNVYPFIICVFRIFARLIFDDFPDVKTYGGTSLKRMIGIEILQLIKPTDTHTAQKGLGNHLPCETSSRSNIWPVSHISNETNYVTE